MKAAVYPELIQTTFRHLAGKGWRFADGAEGRALRVSEAWPQELPAEDLFHRVKDVVSAERDESNPLDGTRLWDNS